MGMNTPQVKEYVKDGGNLKSCLLAKFSKNLIYRKLLLYIGNGYDCYSFCPRHWGQNVLGETLMEVREILRKRVPTLEEISYLLILNLMANTKRRKYYPYDPIGLFTSLTSL